MRKLIAFLLFVAFISAGPHAQAQMKDKAAGSSAAVSRFGNVDSINAKQLREWLTFIASDELEGRDTPSRGLDIAALYIASHLSGLGIRPAGDEGSYFQKFPLKRNRIDASSSRIELAGRSYNYGDDFLAAYNPGTVEGNLVYVSHGWVLKSKNINPYEGLDVKGKIIIAVNSLPKGVGFGDLKGPPGADWLSPQLYAQQNGAKGVVLFSSFNALAGWQTTRDLQTNTGNVSFGKSAPSLTIPTVTISPRLINAIFQGEKSNGNTVFTKAVAGDFVPSFELAQAKRLKLQVAVRSEETHTQNVVGILEGSDPVLKNEYVAIGAHYDHVGMNPNAPGDDKIFNGADDDGSGTVAVMAIAEAFAKSTVKPKRSILFIWHAGEEKGLWGSEYFTDNPTVPISSIITQLNIDMIGRYQNPGDENHPQNKDLPKQNEIYTIGASMMSTELGQISNSVNKELLNLNFNLKYDAADHPEQFFYRSDHFNYARKGIPIIFYMDGSHADYHQVSDHVDKINFASMEKVTKTIFATGWELANRAARPKVDKPLPANVIGN